MSTTARSATAAVEEAVAALRAGGMVVVVDDPGREDEGDLVMAAAHATPEAINFMITHARGLVCVPMARERLDALGVPPMVVRSTDQRETAFHVGVDLHGQSTGISAAERAATARALADPATPAPALSQPGHVFPLAGRPGGVLERAGHTEASIELVQLAGAGTAAVICEIADDDGEMMRLPALRAFAERHDLPLLTIADLVDHVTRTRPLVQRVSAADVPMRDATFTVVGYRDLVDGREHLAAVLGDVDGGDEVLVRVHSECLTGDVLGSRRCDCGEQLELALSAIAAEGRGILVYLRGHEGRGIGLLEKLAAYQLQDQGLDTVDANLALGHPADARDYGIAAGILTDLGVGAVRLMTNNPDKRAALDRHGVAVASTVGVVSTPTAANVRYLTTKRMRMGHALGS